AMTSPSRRLRPSRWASTLCSASSMADATWPTSSLSNSSSRTGARVRNGPSDRERRNRLISIARLSPTFSASGETPSRISLAWMRLFLQPSEATPRGRRSLRATVVVLDADDVVLAEIAAGLHLDQLQHDLAGIVQPVHRAHRDINRLVLVHGLDVVIDGDARRAAHHDPVLGAMVVLLQREPVAWLD